MAACPATPLAMTPGCVRIRLVRSIVNGLTGQTGKVAAAPVARGRSPAREVKQHRLRTVVQSVQVPILSRPLALNSLLALWTVSGMIGRSGQVAL